MFTTEYVMAKAEEHRRSYNSLLDDRRDRWKLLNDPTVASGAIIPPSSRLESASMRLRSP